MESSMSKYHIDPFHVAKKNAAYRNRITVNNEILYQLFYCPEDINTAIANQLEVYFKVMDDIA